nr:hypothetical protein [Tanacetum cinerariifolium]
MVAILEKGEFNIDFHPMVDFIAASPLRIETTDEGIHILATVDGIQTTVSESSLRRNLKLRDEDGIVPIPDTELFENLTLMGHNTSQNQKLTFQKGQFLPSVETSALPHESSPRVTSLDADEGNMQQKLQELMDLCTGLQRQQTQMADKIKAQDLDISGLKARVMILEDKDRGREEPQEDASIKGGSMDIGEEVKVERSTELGSNDTKEMVNVLSAMEADNILTSGVAAVSVSPVAAATTVGVPTVSGLVPNVSAIFTTASVVTPYSRRPREISAKDKGKEKVVESGVPKKKKLQEQIDAQVAREIEEEFARDNQRLREKIELINELVKYQDHHAKILKYHAQQNKPLSKKEQREFYMSVLRSHAGWKTKHFKGMTLKEIKEKFIPVWKQIEDFVPMSSKEEGERMKRKGLKLDQGSSKRMKTSEDVSEEDLKGMMQLVPVEEATKDKEKELWVELKRLFEPDFKDQLWTHTQNLMHDLLDWKL